VSEAPVVDLEKEISASYVRLSLNGTTFILHNDALDSFHAQKEESLPHFLRRAYADGRLEKAKKWLGFGYNCVPDPNGRDFYILGPRPNGKMVPLREQHGMNSEERAALYGNVFEAPSLSKSGETRLEETR
jgi:hypothetical protein